MLRPMFGMGGTEILVILVVAMIFLGPEKLPEAAAKISKGIRDIRKQQRELTQTIENDTEIGGALRELKSALRGDEVRRPPVRKPPPAEETPPAADAPAGDAPTAPADATSEPAPTEAAADDDPMKLIRPAAGTAKREHG
jgi:sec-independent protein translocase protein TatB